MVDKLNVSVREEKGKRRVRRLRRDGFIPAVLYGHGEENIVLSVPEPELDAAIRHGSQLVDLTGAVSESALIREVQWDTYGLEVLHIDLTRVSKTEQVEVTVSIELRGDAPGTREGGVVEQLLHEVDIECPAVAIPESITVNINDLNLDDVITADQLELPEGGTLITSAEQPVVQCLTPLVEEEEAVPGVETIEPEVIGREDEEAAEGEKEGEE